MKLGLVVHSGRDDSVAAAHDALRVLHDLDVDVVVAADGGPGADLPAPTAPRDSFATGLDLAVSFGGDGTFLRAAYLCRDASVPVLGVNLGHLGFLAEVELDDLGRALRAVAAGDYTVEERGTLEVGLEDSPGRVRARDWALNEVSVEKSARQRLLRMDVYVGESLFAGVPADALVLATSTGSTAYAFSAGGPILSPRVEAVLVTPVAPHSLFDRTLVAGTDETVRVVLHPDQEPAVVSCDGRRPAAVPAGGSVVVRGGGRPVALARVGQPDFYGLLRRKFNLH